MYLKRLEIHGFKSFAQKTTMEFSQGIIAIVGPNGSGKSNVADALRWVLGEQSMKLMRGKKSDDVIFAGSDKKVRLGFCEVVATFDNQDRRIPLDSPEVSIGRRMDRSGESNYLINGQVVRLLDVVDLVLRSGIGTSRYTVIGQGTIDQMVLQGPQEVKNLIDEASGVKSYYLKRDKSLRRLEQTAQNLMRAEDLIAEIEPRLKSLRRQAKRLEARAELEQELKVYQREYFGKQYWHLHGVLVKLSLELDVFGAQREDLEKTTTSLRKQIEKFETESANTNSQQSVFQNELNVLQSKKNKMLEDQSMVRGKMQSKKTASGADAASLSVRLHELERQIAELSDSDKTELAKQAVLENRVQEAKSKLSSISLQISRLSEELQGPKEIDWQIFEKELGVLEAEFFNFNEIIVNFSDTGALQNGAEKFKIAFERFSKNAKEEFSEPQKRFQRINHDLQRMLAEKDALSDKLRDMELEATKIKLSSDFLLKQLSEKQQERLHVELELKGAASGSEEAYLSELSREDKRISENIAEINLQIASKELHLKTWLDEQSDDAKKLRRDENALRQLQDQLSKLKDEENKLKVEKAKYDTQMQGLYEEAVKSLGEEGWKAIGEHFEKGATEGLEGKIERLKNQLETIGGMDELTLKEYQETETRHLHLSTQVEDLKKSMQDLRQIIDELDEHIKTRFNESFHKISEKFEHYFRILFNGGRAYLSLVKAEEKKPEVLEEEIESEDMESTESKLRPEEKVVKKYEQGASNIIGIDIKATPPGKKLSQIQALSGGERSLTSIGLLMSLLTCFPSPFVVLDEVDAALDDANTIRFAQILNTLAGQTQFVTITHNRETMAHAEMLYGVTMGDDGVSKLLSVKLEQAKVYAK